MDLTGDWILLNGKENGFGITRFYPTANPKIVKDATYTKIMAPVFLSVAQMKYWRFNRVKKQFFTTDSVGYITPLTIVKLKHVDSNGDITVYTDEQRED